MPAMLRPGFELRLVHVGFVVDKVALRQIPLLAFQFSPSDYNSTNVPSSSIIQGWYNRPI
jgi:hypothetical protein